MRNSDCAGLFCLSTARGLNFAFGRTSEGKRKKTHERARVRACFVCLACCLRCVRAVHPGAGVASRGVLVCCACASASVRAVCVLCVLCVLCGDSACAVV